MNGMWNGFDTDWLLAKTRRMRRCGGGVTEEAHYMVIN